MKTSYPIVALIRRFAFGGLALVTLIVSGCESVSDGDSANAGYYSQPQLTPIEGASMMQDRLGQITRSQIR